MRFFAILLSGFLFFSCGKKSENQGAAASRQFSPVTQSLPEGMQQVPTDTLPTLLSSIKSQAEGMNLPGTIAFWRGGQLYYMDGNGGNQRRPNPVIRDGYGKISWAPDGERLTFSARGKIHIEYPIAGEWNSYPSEVFTTHIDSNHWYTQLTDNFGSSYPDWSKDGKTIWASIDLSANKFNNLFEPTYPNFQLFRANLGTDTFTTRIYSCPSSGLVRAQVLQPAVSPDGKKMAFTLAATNSQGLPEVVGLVIVPAGEIKLGFQELLAEAGKRPKGYAASWSPDGKQLAYVTTLGGKPDLYLMPPDGSAERLFLASNDSRIIGTTAPGWSPDGKWLCFASTAGGIYVVSTDGKKLYQLTQTGADFHPAWSPK